MKAREEFASTCLDIYDQVNFIPVSGCGSRLYDKYGTEVIDLAGGIAVNALGHAHPKLIEALNRQAQQLWHVSNIMVNQPALDLAKVLVRNTCFDKAFICNSGTEAVEAGLKLARRYALINFGREKHKIVSFKNSFHGRTLFAVSAGGQSKYSEEYAPLPGGIEHGVFNDLTNAEKLINQETAVVIVEPIQAEGGVVPATAEFLYGLRQLCNKNNAILMFDEVQTGVGRTGKLFAYQHYEVEPDIISLAKALGGGFPIGAILVKDKFRSGFGIGSHGTTFGGNPLASAVANAVLEIINTPDILAGVLKRSEIFKSKLQQINVELDIYRDIRGLGLLIGAELKPKYQGKAREIMNLGFEHGVATLIASPNVTRFTPSLIIPQEDIHIGLDRVYQALKQFKVKYSKDKCPEIKN